MSQCPNGHATAATDYCDVCGAPVAAAPASVAPPAPSVPADVTCPNCGTPNAHDTLFCENCGYDFTTGAKPRAQAPSSLLDLDSPLPEQPAAKPAPTRDATEEQAERPGEAPHVAVTSLDLDPVAPAPEPPDHDAAPAEPAAEPQQTAAQPIVFAPTQQHQAVPDVAPPEAQPQAEPEPQAGQGEAGAADTGEGSLLHAASSRLTRPLEDWNTVAEVWIDPEWFKVQECDEPMPSPGLPTVVPLRHTRALIGRISRSRGIEPEIDCGTDSSVSRRQAELTTDGLRWWVEDLGSANGTYVGAVSAPLPQTPIPKRTEVLDGERIYVGAWTRIVLRRATDDERAAFAQG